ncbi:MAG: M16 family metallopeptidase [Vulcanimicrobiota bacterium]
MFNKTILENGIKILTEEVNEFKSASIGVWVHAGPRNETEKDSGISHFIEHMMFKGTEKRTSRDIAEIMDSVGGQLNAFTEKEQTCYYVRVMDKHIPLALDVLSDMFNNSRFEVVEIDRERKVILEEINMYEDDPEDKVFEVFNKTLWGCHPLSSPTLGNKETVGSFNRQDFMNYMKGFYTPDNITVAAAGHFNHWDLVDIIETNFGHLQGKSLASQIEPPMVHSRENLHFKDCEQTYICTGGRGISQKDPRKYAFFVLDSIIGGSMSSRLFQEVRERRGLVYTISTFTNAYYDSAQFGIFACTSRNNLKEVVTLIRNIVDEVRENGITEKEIRRAKEHIKGSISLGLESTSNRMIRLNKSELYYNRLIPIEEVIKKVEEVTVEDIKNVASEILDRSQYATTVLGPIKDDIKNYIGE